MQKINLTKTSQKDLHTCDQKKKKKITGRQKVN